MVATILVGRRRHMLVIASVVFIFVLLNDLSSSAPPRLTRHRWRVGYSRKPQKPTLGDPEDGNFHWSQVKPRYPVENVLQLPVVPEPLPRIQHQFLPETSNDRRWREAHLSIIRREFLHAWNGYRKYAWLADELCPLSASTRTSFGGWAATLVDSLDTLWIMGLKHDFGEAVNAVGKLDFSTCDAEELNVFETTIRYLGGLLAAYDLSEGRYPILLRKAWELGSMLLVAFDTPSGIPSTRWDFKAAAEAGQNTQEEPESALSAEVGSLTLEFTRLAQLTEDSRFYSVATRIMDIFAAQQNDTLVPGIWPVIVNGQMQDFRSFPEFTIGGMADSLYEYLPKQYLLLGGGDAGAMYRDMFESAAHAIKKNLIYRPMTHDGAHILMVGDVKVDGDSAEQTLTTKNQHLTCFAGGMFALAGKVFRNVIDLEVGKKLTKGCIWAYENSPNGVMPEIMYTMPCKSPSECTWNEKQVEDLASKLGKDVITGEGNSLLKLGIAGVEDPRYILRPEAIESVFVLYRLTGDVSLLHRSWPMFESIINATKTDIAHAALGDCISKPPSKMDSMESFWTAETLKYFYLLWADPKLVSLDGWVFNTEAHPFRRPVWEGKWKHEVR